MTNEEKAREYLLKEHISPLNNILHQCDLKTELQYHKDIENAFIKGAEWKDKQYLNADFIFKVLQMAETYCDKRCKAAVATNIANELIMEKEYNGNE